MNLITNAYHAVEEAGGAISVRLTETELTGDDLAGKSLAPGKYVMLTVSDTGCGIDPSVINRIFEPYFTTKEQGKGTGLGLSVVHGIVKEHGGEINVSSEIGRGAAFNVYLPLLKDTSKTQAADMPVIYQTGTERILLVDDEKPIVRMEQMVLENLGYHVTPLTSSLEALAVFKATPHDFDLVITDMNMPEMTGLELAGELNSIRPGVPILICSGFSSKLDEKSAGAKGINGFLMKPVVKTEMAKMVRTALDQGKCRDI
jgi:CheY-like chemotaxis protein